jgi:hypothetical protein
VGPHLADFEIRYRRGALRVVIPVCDRSMPAEVARLLATDVEADGGGYRGVAVDALIRLVRVRAEPCGEIT